MHLRSEGFGLFVALTGLLLCVPASAQQPQSSPAQTPNGTSRVLVTDGLPVWPRIAEDVQFVGDGPFRIADGVHVFEDGVKQPGATLQKAAQPASICLMIDVSSSMKPLAQRLWLSARASSSPSGSVHVPCDVRSPPRESQTRSPSRVMIRT